MLGKYLEARAKGRTGKPSKKLLGLQAKTARIERGGEALELPIDEVVGGTLNKTGAFRFSATKVGADTVLSQIIKMVEDAQGSKVPIQTLADRVMGVFVPVVIGITLVTFGVWLVFGPSPALTFALVNAVAVLTT